jgi:hypothetical protein
MHNDTPLGTTMHLKELDRQAAAKSRSLRPILQSTWPATAINVVAIALLRRLRAVGSSRGLVEGQGSNTTVIFPL